MNWMTCLLFFTDKVPADAFPPMEIVFEDETTIIIQRPDTEDKNIKRKDKMVFKDGLMFERFCLE